MDYKEWLKLPDDKKREEYKKLSDHDRFLIRISEPPKVTVVGYGELTEEEKEEARERRQKNKNIVDVDESNIKEITEKIFKKKNS